MQVVNVEQIVFEILNSKSSRNREQTSLARMSQQPRRRMVSLDGEPLRPGRSRYMSKEEFMQRIDSIREADKCGAITIRFNGVNINTDAAIALIEGREVHPPFYSISNVNDPMSKDKGDGAQIRMPRQVIPTIYRETEPTKDETTEVTSLEDLEVPVTVELGNLDLLLSVPEQVEEKEATTEAMTIKEVAEYLGKSTSWVRKEIRKGELRTQEIEGVQKITSEQLTKYLVG